MRRNARWLLRPLAADALYEPENGRVTLKDVALGADHYYVELQDQGGFNFHIAYLQALTGQTRSHFLRYDPSLAGVTIPSIFAVGNFYGADLILGSDSLFHPQHIFQHP